MSTAQPTSTTSRPSSPRWQVAFSLRRNLQRLFVPSGGHLRPLDGLRALSILWLVLFHAGWYIGFHIPPAVYAQLVLSPWMVPVWRGDFGVDIFFVLSGFLIAGALADERTETGRLRFARFYARRLMRLSPALLVAALANLSFIHDHPETAWASVIYVSNFIPIMQSTMGWTWSLSVEEQFYLVCPWLVLALGRLSMRVRVGAFALLMVALCLLAATIVSAGSFHSFDAEIVVNRNLPIWANAYDHLYAKPWMRAAPLVAGMAAAYLYRSGVALEALSRHRFFAGAGLLLALTVAAASTHWQLVIGAPRLLEVAYLAGYRAAFGLSVAYVMLLSLSQHPWGRALGALLSWRGLHPLAQLAYSAYLLNPIVTTLVDRALAPLVWAGKAPPFPLFLPFDLLGTFAAAMVLYLFVERPFMELRSVIPWLARSPTS